MRARLIHLLSGTTVRGVAGSVALLALCAGAAPAHPLAPALLDLRELGGGRVAVRWKTSRFRVPGAEVAPVLPELCRNESAPSTVGDLESVTTTYTMACNQAGLVGQAVGFRGLDEARIGALVRVTLADGRVIRGVVRADEPLLTIPGREDRLDIVRTYLRAGIQHILRGVDHLLFVAGLLLLVRGRRQLIETIAAFAVGHSLTLALAVFDVVRPPERPIELLIALSVFALAAELARDPAARPSWVRRRPWVLALGFGLLHGLGFAGALQEIVGLPHNDVPLALCAFNIGIEIGQLAFIAVLVAVAAGLRAWHVVWPRWVQRAPLYTIGSLAAFWCLERAAALVR